jgi:hypothetical protein
MCGPILKRLAASALLLLTLVIVGCRAEEPASDPLPTSSSAEAQQPPSQESAGDLTRSPESQPAKIPETVAVNSEELPDLGPAPELDNEVWLNSDGPLTLASLRGRVVLLEFWTFG